MGWQLPADHASVLDHPRRCFGDQELRRGQVLRDAAGRFQARSGQLADVYEVRSLASHQRWAVKCYREEVPGLDVHYRALAEHLVPLDLPCLASFQYLDRGLCVRGTWFPAVKMLWVDGVPLGAFVGQVADQPTTLHFLTRLWLRLLTDLRRAGVAHGALQHDHVLVTPGGAAEPLALRLIDYDATYVLARDGAAPCEVGHPNYQHPQRIWQQVHDLDSDRFPALVVYTALRAVASHGPELWRRHDGGDNLLFRERDFQEPSTSAVFRELWRSHDSSVRALAGRLLLAAQGGYRQVPSLKQLVAENDSAPPQAVDEPPRFTLSPDQERQVESLLAGLAGGESSAPPPLPKKTFGLLIDQEGAAPGLAAAVDRADEDFGVEVEDQPDHRPPPSPIMPARSRPRSAPPPLPQATAPAPAPAPVTFELDDPYTATYYLEAWMPERVAVMKVQGFVDAATGEVILSAPGLMRVRMLDPYEVAEPPKPGLLAWLGFVESAPRARTLALLEFHMQHKDTEFQKRVAITLYIRPGDDEELPPLGRWRAYCNKLFCDVRGFLMGTR